MRALFLLSVLLASSAQAEVWTWQNSSQETGRVHPGREVNAHEYLFHLDAASDVVISALTEVILDSCMGPHCQWKGLADGNYEVTLQNAEGEEMTSQSTHFGIAASAGGMNVSSGMAQRLPLQVTIAASSVPAGDYQVVIRFKDTRTAYRLPYRYLVKNITVQAH